MIFHYDKKIFLPIVYDFLEKLQKERNPYIMKYRILTRRVFVFTQGFFFESDDRGRLTFGVIDALYRLTIHIQKWVTYPEMGHITRYGSHNDFFLCMYSIRYD